MIPYSITIWFLNLMLAGGLAWFYQSVIGAQEADAAQVRGELTRLEESRRLLKEREASFAAWQPFDRKLRDFFFEQEKLVAWLEFLEQEARARNLAFNVASLDEQQSEAPKLHVTIRGNRSDTLAFLRAAQSGPYGIFAYEGVMRKGSASDMITQLIFLFYVHKAS